MGRLQSSVRTLSARPYVSGFPAGGEPRGQVEFSSEAQSCDQSRSARKKNENETLVAQRLSLGRNRRCGWAAPVANEAIAVMDR